MINQKLLDLIKQYGEVCEQKGKLEEQIRSEAHKLLDNPPFSNPVNLVSPDLTKTVHEEEPTLDTVHSLYENRQWEELDQLALNHPRLFRLWRDGEWENDRIQEEDLDEPVPTEELINFFRKEY